MVKETIYRQPFLNCKVKDFFEILYADGSAAVAYHREADKDENARVEAWQGNTRVVHFTMPMQIPAIIAKIIRTERIPVKEVQKVETDEDGNLHVTSTPQIGVPGGDKFVAVAKLKIRDTVQGCLVEARVVCTAGGPFGLKGMIEGIMVDQSATSVKQYIKFCSQRCQSKLMKLESGEPGSPRSDSTVFEQFFDAQETLSRSTSMSSMASDSGQQLLGGSSQPAALDAQGFIDAVEVLKILDALDGRWYGWLTADGKRLDVLQSADAHDGPASSQVVGSA